MRAVLLDRLPNLETSRKTDPRVPVNGVKVSDARLVSALLRYGTFDCYFYIREYEKNSKAETYANANRLTAVDLGSIESLGTMVNDELLLFTSSHHPAKYVPLRQHLRRNSWPICGRTHGLSGSHLMPSYVWNQAAALMPHDAVICTSVAAKEALDRIHQSVLETTGLAYLPATPHLALDGVDAPAQSVRERDAKDQFVIVSLGRFSASYKADLRPVIVEFCLSEDLPAAATLILAGDNSRGEAAEIQQFANSLPTTRRVIVMPDIEEGLKQSLLEMADAGLIVSDTYDETFGLAILEAMAAGLPVVAPDWSGYRDIVVEGETGFLIPTFVVPDTGLFSAACILVDPSFLLGQRISFDCSLIMRKLASLARNRDMAFSMGERGRRRVEQYFSWQRIVHALEEQWQSQFEQAKHCATIHTTQANWIFDYDHVFRGYPSAALSNNSHVSCIASPEKLTLLRQGKLFTPSPITGFCKQIDEEILELCSFRNNISISELVSALAATNSCGESMVLTHVARLLKYGVLSTLQGEQKKGVADGTSEDCTLGTVCV